MKIKTYYARTMAEALKNVKNELGEEALILSSKENPRRTSPWFRNKPSVEVVAAVDDGHDAGLVAPGQTAVDSASSAGGGERDPRFAWTPGGPEDDPAGATPKTRQGRQKVPQLDEEHSEIRRALYSLTRPAGPCASQFSHAAAFELYQDLVANEVNEWLAYKLIDEAQRALSPEECGRRDTLFGAVTQVARGLIRRDASEDGLPGRRVVAFVGPTGVGKTTAVAKLGARLALEQKKKVVLMTTDNSRIGAVEQLKTFAGLMGLPFRAVYRVSDLPGAIREHGQRDFILIDTAGRCQRDLESVHELMGFLQEAPEIERHLVLSATTKQVDLFEIVDRFGICSPDRLLFTKLDETSTFGPIFNALVRTQKPLSYVADGQRVPEDLHTVPGDRIIDIVLNIH